MNARHSYISILDCGKLPDPFDRITMTTSIFVLSICVYGLANRPIIRQARHWLLELCLRLPLANRLNTYESEHAESGSR